MTKKVFFACLFAAASLLLSFPLLLNPEKEIRAESEKSALSQKDLFPEIKNLEKLPATGKIENYKARNEQGKAILLPQTHLYPGSDPQDQINDDAEIAQREIYDLILNIKKETGINFLMLEGDLYGPEAPKNKTEIVSSKIKAKSKLSDLLKRLESEIAKKNIDENLGEKIAVGLETLIKTLDREIILKGAGYALKASGEDLFLIGSENKETQEKSAEIARKYLYLQDQKKELAAHDGGKNLGMLNIYALNSQKEKLRNPTESLLKNLGVLKEKKDVKDLALLIEEAVSETRKPETSKQISGAPKRSDNPYKNVKSEAKINSLIKETETEINKTVKDLRNKETSENFVRALEENNLTSGMIVFGAAHTEGLVKELNSRGISVIVVTPEKILEK